MRFCSVERVVKSWHLQRLKLTGSQNLDVVDFACVKGAEEVLCCKSGKNEGVSNMSTCLRQCV
jgi:hypothetical protein